jgi:hypothetical protein
MFPLATLTAPASFQLAVVWLGAAWCDVQALLLLLHPAMVVAWIASGSLHGLMS